MPLNDFLVSHLGLEYLVNSINMISNSSIIKGIYPYLLWFMLMFSPTHFLSLEILIGLFSCVSAKPAHLASFGYVFP